MIEVRRHGNAKVYDQAYVLDRIVVDENGCWIWQRQIEPRGYGRVPRASGEQLAHRLAWRLWKGEITTDSLDHLCRNRACCNPEHLEDVGRAINSSRARRLVPLKTHCKRGHELTEENVYRNPKRPTLRNCRECMALRARNR